LYQLNCEAQKKASPEIQSQVASQFSFLIHAPVDLPALLERKQYDTMGYYLQNWKNSNYPNLEFIFAMQVLLAIQSDKYSSFQLPFDCLDYLSVYAKQQNAMLIKDKSFRYYINLEYPYRYDATENVRGTILFIKSWSRELIKTRKLTKSQLFICRTLTGDITEPLVEYKSDPEICPDIEQVQEQLQACKKRNFIDERNDVSRGTLGMMVGGWFPTRDLRNVVDAHPTLGFSFGWRNRLNEVDFSYTYRFIHTTPQPYTCLKQDTLYSKNFYEGAYCGIDYTRYLVHTKRTDIGLIAGMGWDYFNLTADSEDPSGDDNLAPGKIQTVNWNVGIRYKYFVRKRLNLGLVARYNKLYYKNTETINLDGNAFSLEFTIGIN
jgi:hypothetical protein